MKSLNEADSYIAIATIGKPVGLFGWCRLFPLGETIASLKLPFKLTAGFNQPSEELILKEIVLENQVYKALFSNFDSREKIDVLKNKQVFIHQKQLPKKSDGEYYHFELEGCVVYEQNSGLFLGTVIEVHNYPTTDALEIKPISGKNIVIPFMKDSVISVDLEQKKIVVNDTFLDIDSSEI